MTRKDLRDMSHWENGFTPFVKVDIDRLQVTLDGQSLTIAIVAGETPEAFRARVATTWNSRYSNPKLEATDETIVAIYS